MRKHNKQDNTEHNQTKTRCGPFGFGRKGHNMRTSRHRGRNGGGHGSKRNRRPLGHGDLSLLILSLIEETPRHGYDMITQIEARTGGAYKPSPGVIYPALEVLQDIGLAEIIPDGAKKIYQITQDGKATLADKAEELAKIVDTLANLAEPKDDQGPSSVRMAMQQLHHAIKSHMRNSDVSDEEREKIVTILDEARQKITSDDAA